MSACPAPEAPPTEPVAEHLILITVDTLRADHLGFHGYVRPTSPNLDRFAAAGLVFDQAWVQWPATTPSMTSMFSGTYPHANGVVVQAHGQKVPDDLLLLPEVLRDAGFHTAAVVSNSVLGLESNFPQGFLSVRELWKETGGSRAERVTAVAFEELDRALETGNRFFLWVHYVDPHWPYSAPPQEQDRFVGDEHHEVRRVPLHEEDHYNDGISSKRWQSVEGIDDVGWYVARYDGEIRYTDAQIQRFLDRLAADAIDERALVVLTADHGESLGDHEYYFAHGQYAYQADVHVPLVFRRPVEDRAGERVTRPVELRSLARTVVSALLPQVDNPFPGEDLLSSSLEQSQEPVLVFSQAGGPETLRNASYTVAVRDRSTKLVHARNGWARRLRGGRHVELYDLSRDPDELHDLAPSRPEDVRRLVFAVRELFERRPPTEPTLDDSQSVSEETRRNLRTLGYID